ncbi:MAG: type II toxin-antitoxin system RelB/DinJ family antitoxin [Eubacterium sp.]|nr:type II toxin-antitoxin system RelB/DinJ family antitoxin [Eubacterium sp.]MDD6568109.1 type II toxin-antitoxin system RelB/DinJ family antitoxin [Eubacteriales bacterium]MDY4110523.1 type II toxin-antitoxin system RelB/DinJ family antitoxin [Eubacterium sp.]
MLNVTNSPKTATFQMRINPEIKKEVESIYANCGMTLTDAINAFLQQTINVGGMPFILNQNSEKVLKKQALELLMAELNNGENSAKFDSDWISEKEMLEEFGTEL